MSSFPALFREATGLDPFPYQRALATGSRLPDLLEAPTGAGKTAAVLLGWLWRRRFAEPATRAATPRRLVYTLPMRSLVLQTEAFARRCLAKLALDPGIAVHALLGGDVDNDWDLHPDADAVLIGTQDQFLSRALNRGYALSRFRWPLHFGLLHSDALWVFDEVQLMGPGLSTSAQLQGIRAQLGAYGPAGSLWMSATLDPGRLATVDHAAPLTRLALSESDRAHPALARRLNAQKPLRPADSPPPGDPHKDRRGFAALADEVLSLHDPDSRTLVVLNRVDRAIALYRALQGKTQPVSLIHGRFRPADRAAASAALDPNWNGVLIATQAVEAGVDLSARLLFTELAPWASLVQRFGRCNRAGEHGADRPAAVRWIDHHDPDREAAPYTPEALHAARARLCSLDDVGLATLSALSDPPQRPHSPVLRRRDLLQLFDTTPDLTGSDLDISRFIRDAGGPEVSVAWRDWEGRQPPEDLPALQPDELCRVPVYRLLELLKKSGKRAFSWDGLSGQWRAVDRVLPGAALLLHAETGGYAPALGFTGDPADRPTPIPAAGPPPEREASDPLSETGDWVSLAQHASDVAAETRALAAALAWPDLPEASLITAGRWHDLGKVHPAFQAMLAAATPPPDPGPWAKSPGGRAPRDYEGRRPHFRHELASALAWLDGGGDFLVAYLVAAHHGKVRAALRARPGEPPDRQDPKRKVILGVWDGEALPAADLGEGVQVPERRLSLDLAELGGAARSWAAQVDGLLGALGPFRLAFLEALIRAADRRVSARYSTTSAAGGAR